MTLVASVTPSASTPGGEMIHLHSLGQCMITVGATRVLPTTRLVFASALYVALEGTRTIARDAMAGLFWPELDEERATHSLRQALYRLRAQGIPINGDAERLVLPTGLVSTDYDELLGPSATFPVDEMLTRIPGGFLPGYMPTISRPFADWVEGQRERVNGALRRQLVTGIKALRAAGDWPATQALAQRCLELDPLNEEATLAYAEAMAMDGSKARAIMIIDRYMNEIGPRAKELFLPATTLKKRIAALYPLPPVIEKDPPQIGREEEMEKLDKALTDARQGRGSAFLISGPPGMGKTRLVTEFTRAAHLKGIPVARSQMGRHDDHRPLGAWSDLVPLLQRMPGALGCDPESLPFLARLTTYDSKQTTPSPESQDAEYLFARIRMAVLDLVGAVANESCVILLIEDVHWMDEWSWDVVSALTKRLEKTGVLILMTLRDRDQGSTPPSTEAAVSRMCLEPLSETKCRTLLGVVGPISHNLEDDFSQWCVRTCAGNPYFLIELARRAIKAGGHFQAPPSLTRLILERFLNVAPLSRRILQAAAVLGRNSTLTRIERILGESRLALLDCFDELSRHSLIQSEGERILCRHDLLGMSALTDISEPSLRVLHRHAAEALESEMGDSAESAQLWDAALHWERSGDSRGAVRSWNAAATSALEMGTVAEAARALEHVVALSPSVSDRQSACRRLIRVLYIAREFVQVVRVSDELRGSAQGSDELARQSHTQEELLELDSRTYSTGPERGTLARLLLCASTDGASPLHRVHAALIACKLASDLFIRRAGHRAFLAVIAIVDDVPAPIADELRLVYFASFGDTEMGSRAGANLALHFHTRSQRAERSRALAQYANGVYANGEIAAVESLLRESIAIAQQLHLAEAVLPSAHALARLGLQVGDVRLAEEAVSLLLAAPISASKVRSGMTESLQVRLALRKQDIGLAARLVGQSSDPWIDSWPRAAVSHAATRCLLRMMRDGWVPDEQDMRRMLALHRRARRYAHHDFAAYVTLRMLAARGDEHRGHVLFTLYVTEYRRERGPLLPELQEIGAQLARERA